MLTVKILPTAYFGSIGYFQRITAAEMVEIENSETYPKQTFRNRAQILTANGALSLSIPVVKPNGSKSKTGEIHTDNSQNWKNTHWRAIESAYASAPFFEHYEKELRELVYAEEENLVLRNLNQATRILSLVDLAPKISIAKDYQGLNLEQENELLQAYRKYKQVFKDYTQEHLENLSVLDAWMNLGPMFRGVLG